VTTLDISTRGGETLYLVADESGRVLYRARLSARVSGYAEGAVFTVPLDPTEHSVESWRTRALRAETRIDRARTALQA
jgi:hypothetical protein